MKLVFYQALFHEENGEYWVSFPDFPECFSDGSNIEEAYKNAKEALDLCISDRLLNNEELPKPSLKCNTSEDEERILIPCEYKKIA